jgi:short-subunit dehydrogenase
MNNDSSFIPIDRTTTSMVLITGATGGLGRAFAVECASRGWDLLLTDLDAERLEVLAGGLRRAYGVRVLYQPCDLTDPAARSVLFERIRTEQLYFWSLINIAGLDFEGLFHERTRQQIRTIIRLNIEGTLEMTHALLEFRDRWKPFRIVNVASLAAFSPMPIKATYAASKRFLLDFSLALREEVRPLGATVTVLCPAGMPTTAQHVEAIQAQGWLGQLTTQNVGAIAAHTLDAALKGQAVVIPGLLNRVARVLSWLAPATFVASLLGNRWQSAHQSRAGWPAPSQAVLTRTADAGDAA